MNTQFETKEINKMEKTEITKQIRKYQTFILTHESSIITCKAKVNKLYDQLKLHGLKAYM